LSRSQFDLIEKEATEATAVKKVASTSNLLSFINCCSWWQSDQFTAVKILLAKQTRKGDLGSQMVAEVKGLVGAQTEMQSFLKLFKQKVEKLEDGPALTKLILTESEATTTSSLENENPYYL
jgi:hypothetical protein